MLQAWTDLFLYVVGSKGVEGAESHPDSWAYLVLLRTYFAVFVVGTTPLLLAGIAAPYGRFSSAKWGPAVPAWIGWIVMEAPSPLLFWSAAALALAFDPLSVDLPSAAFALETLWSVHDDLSTLQSKLLTLLTALGTRRLVLIALWSLHYINRSFIFPLRMKYSVQGKQANGAQMPIMVVLSAVFFNIMNGYVNGRSAFGLAPSYAFESSNTQFYIGVAMFLFGFAVNNHSDAVLRSLRGPGESGYKIPNRGFYKYVSNANYFGEIVEWLGYSIASNSPAGVLFFLATCANLVPRAISNHKWYLEKFRETYPRDRRIIIPYIY
eukprot:TRINITY_DN3303_c0_g4_i1.p1 TRINITY_DN3303_c0_g4~~TRINITY_DN3303_c0_g4_i1.p1  ORF type:complete len:333 (+),score=56.44 TRINITY_DN3303_c0_g4_i1:33-1001(+)